MQIYKCILNQVLFKEVLFEWYIFLIFLQAEPECETI